MYKRVEWLAFMTVFEQLRLYALGGIILFLIEYIIHGMTFFEAMQSIPYAIYAKHDQIYISNDATKYSIAQCLEFY